MAANLRLVQGAEVEQFSGSGSQQHALKGDGGGGTFDGMPPDFPERVAALEANFKNLDASVIRIDGTVSKMRDRMDTDFRITWGGIIVATLGLAALMAKGFHWI